MRIAHFVLLIPACSNRPDVIVARQLPASIQSDAVSVVTANNQFAIDVYGKLPALREV